MMEPSGPPRHGHIRAGRRFVLGSIAALLAGIGWLYWFPPGQSGFYPLCLFHSLTGLSCPGCGATRALHFLLHGEWAVAFRCNALLVIALPWLAFLAGRRAYRAWNGQPWVPPERLGRWIFLALVGLFLFAGLRNLPLELSKGLLPP